MARNAAHALLECVAANLLSARIRLRFRHKVAVNINIESVYRFQVFHSFVGILSHYRDQCLIGDRTACVGMYLVGLDCRRAELVDCSCPEIAHTDSHCFAGSLG